MVTNYLNFFRVYHSTVIKALGEDAKKVNAKIKIDRNVITKGVDKPGIVGECVIKFELE